VFTIETHTGDKAKPMRSSSLLQRTCGSTIDGLFHTILDLWSSRNTLMSNSTL
jgi:hypothetical protein